MAYPTFLSQGLKIQYPSSYGVDYKPLTYSGADIQRPTFAKETEKSIYDILMRRSQGQDVGYDPARKSSAIELLKSQANKLREDQLRSADARLASSGLSGNARAQEAIAGRVNRDIDRSINEGLSQLNIEDLSRANEERDVNTARLQDFWGAQAGLGNEAARLEMARTQAENQANMGAAEFALRQRMAEDQQGAQMRANRPLSMLERVKDMTSAMEYGKRNGMNLWKDAQAMSGGAMDQSLYNTILQLDPAWAGKGGDLVGGGGGGGGGSVTPKSDLQYATEQYGKGVNRDVAAQRVAMLLGNQKGYLTSGGREPKVTVARKTTAK